MIDMTRDEAREQVARAIWDSPRPIDAWDDAVRLGHVSVRRTRLGADAALSVLWPEVERLRAERDEARAKVIDAARRA